MNKLLLSSALTALALTAPIAAQAQQLPPAVVAVVDRDEIARTCTQCAAASQQIQAQIQQYQAREQQLTAPLQTEGAAIRAALQALPQGGQPDAALQQRIQTIQANQQAAERELAGRQETLRRNQGFLINQIVERMNPLIGQITQQRGASVTLDVSNTLAHNPALNVTAAVLALMNQNAAPFSVTAPPPTPAPAAATPAPATPRPRPQGR